jgi:thiol-disulfide isomerase/thioredoxin
VKDKQFFDEWEASKFVRHGAHWRVAAGTHRYRDYEDQSPDAKIVYSLDFEVLAAKYGDAVDQKQFEYQIPAGANIHDDQQPAAEPTPPAKTRTITVRAVDIAGQPVPSASVRLRTPMDPRELDRVAADANGVARTEKAPEGEDASITVEAPDFRPASWGLGAPVSEIEVILVPKSSGATVDETGKPVADAWITHETLEFRADGLMFLPDRALYREVRDWSDDTGRFTLKQELTLRNLDTAIPFIAVDPRQERMAIQIVQPRDLGRSQTLKLQPVGIVQGQFLLEGVRETLDIRPSLELPTGETVATATTRKELTPEGLRVEFQLRLPPGEYELKIRQSAHHAKSAVRFVRTAGERSLDLGTTVVPAAGPATLIGKPAPQLDVRWRPGEETNWEKLRGQVVVLDFWGVWCGPCVADIPELMDIADQFRDEPVAWIAVHTGEIKDFDEFDRKLAECAKRHWTQRIPSFTMALDRPLPGDDEYNGRTAERYGISVMNTLVVVDQQGNVAGPVQKDRLAETLRRLLDRK